MVLLRSFSFLSSFSYDDDVTSKHFGLSFAAVVYCINSLQIFDYYPTVNNKTLPLYSHAITASTIKLCDTGCNCDACQFPINHRVPLYHRLLLLLAIGDHRSYCLVVHGCAILGCVGFGENSVTLWAPLINRIILIHSGQSVARTAAPVHQSSLVLQFCA